MNFDVIVSLIVRHATTTLFFNLCSVTMQSNSAQYRYKLLSSVVLLKASTTDKADSIQPSKFECENASPQAMRRGISHDTAHPGVPSTLRDT